MKNNLPVILCVGSDKIPGDSIGPMVGEFLKNSFNVRCFVYGALGLSVNGTNLKKYLDILTAAHADSVVIAVDACLSAGEIADEVLVKGGGVNPKKAGTDLVYRTGDEGVLGVLPTGGLNPLSALMSVSIDKVEKIAYKIAFAIYRALSDCAVGRSAAYNIFS